MGSNRKAAGEVLGQCCSSQAAPGDGPRLPAGYVRYVENEAVEKRTWKESLNVRERHGAGLSALDGKKYRVLR